MFKLSLNHSQRTVPVLGGANILLFTNITTPTKKTKQKK